MVSCARKKGANKFTVEISEGLFNALCDEFNRLAYDNDYELNSRYPIIGDIRTVVCGSKRKSFEEE